MKENLINERWNIHLRQDRDMTQIKDFNKTILVETALLGQGLPSIDSDEILKIWPISKQLYLPWVEQGMIRLGHIENFLAVRSNKSWLRVNASNLEKTLDEGYSGFLTASAVMKIAKYLGIKHVVTAGMGGIQGDMTSDDLVFLEKTPIFLIATSPKDSLDINKSLNYLMNQSVTVLSYECPFCNGFLFEGSKILLEKITQKELKDIKYPKGTGCLLLNPLPEDIRVQDDTVLIEAMNRGIQARESHQEYHPAVNKALDELTQGKASNFQLKALVANQELALKIVNGISSDGGV